MNDILFSNAYLPCPANLVSLSGIPSIFYMNSVQVNKDADSYARLDRLKAYKVGPGHAVICLPWGELRSYSSLWKYDS